MGGPARSQVDFDPPWKSSIWLATLVRAIEVTATKDEFP